MESRNNDRIEKISTGRFMISAAAASGDAAVCCELPGGSIAFILSDGMGKGDRAAEESRIVITRLRKMLKDGAKAAAAIKTLNRYMIEKSGREENFATVDLTIIDKTTGKAKFYKMGAATSFIVRGGQVRRIQQPALPIGIIPKVKLSHVSVALRPGDIVVMVSDGITEADREDLSALWLTEFLREACARDDIGPKILAAEIAALARGKYGLRERDDLTAVVAVIE